MKPINAPLPKDMKIAKSVQRKFGLPGSKLGFKDPVAKRQRIVLSVNAGHVRGGHSFH